MSEQRQVVILAGGLATRLGERARCLPKYLMQVGGRPFACWQLERLARAGYRQCVLCIGHGGALVRAALGDGAKLGIEILYSDDGERPRGTAGALRQALPLLEDTFLLTYGDSLLPFDYALPLDDLRANPEARCTMSVLKNDSRWDRSNVRVEGLQVTAYAKTAAAREEAGGAFQHIDYGALALSRATIGASRPDRSDLAPLLAELAASGTMRALPVSQRFYEIGSPAGLAELDRLLGEGAVLGRDEPDGGMR